MPSAQFGVDPVLVLSASRFHNQSCGGRIRPLRTWLDSWGIGRIAVGMARQGYNLQLTQYADRGWRATFYTTGMEHSPTSATGTAWERTPWRAVQGAARDALRRAGGDS